MLKRTLLALMFVAGLATVGFGLSGSAQAGHGCGYGGGYGYRSYYPGAAYYGQGFGPRVVYPRASYYRVYDRGYYDHHHHDRYYRGGSGVSISIGF